MPWQWRDDGIPKSAMTIIAKDVGIVMDEARLELFPAPLCTAAEQIFTAALGAGLARVDDGCVIRLYEHFGVPSSAETGTEAEEIEKAKELVVQSGPTPNKVLAIGLGAMGGPMAASIAKAGINVVGYDVNLAAIDKYTQAGGKAGSDVLEEAKDADVVLIATVTAAQAEAVLFGVDGRSGVASTLPEKATVILSSTVAPSDATRIQATLDTLGRGVQLVDAPVSGGPSRASTGELTIMASGSDEALFKADSVLKALSSSSGASDKLHYIRESEYQIRGYIAD